MFDDQFRKNIEAYVNDMLIKSLQPKDHVKDLKEVFGVIKRYDTILNPKNIV